MRDAYTWGSQSGIEAVVAKLDLHTDMSLTRREAEALIRALVEIGDHDCDSDADEYVPDHHDDKGRCEDECWRVIAADVAGSLAESHGVEWI